METNRASGRVSSPDGGPTLPQHPPFRPPRMHLQTHSWCRYTGGWIHLPSSAPIFTAILALDLDYAYDRAFRRFRIPNVVQLLYPHRCWSPWTFSPLVPPIIQQTLECSVCLELLGGKVAPDGTTVFLHLWGLPSSVVVHYRCLFLRGEKLKGSQERRRDRAGCGDLHRFRSLPRREHMDHARG